MTTYTPQELLNEAKRLAALGGHHHWNKLGPSSREDYLTWAKSNLVQPMPAESAAPVGDLAAEVERYRFPPARDDLASRRKVDQLEAELRDALGDVRDDVRRTALAARLLYVSPEQLQRAKEAAAAAAAAQRLLDRVHLEEVVTHTDQGPAVLWADVLRVMPLPQ